VVTMHSPVVIHPGGGVALLRDLVQEDSLTFRIHQFSEAVKEAIDDLSSAI
jgi:hypothetical protein